MPVETLPDHYAELELAATASLETIKAAYVALAKRFHPDVSDDPAASERMQRINDAFAVLGNESRRRAYDLQRLRREVLGGSSDESYGRASRQRSARPGAGTSTDDAGGRPPPSTRTAKPRRQLVMYGALALFGVAVLLVTLLVLGVPVGGGHGQAPATVVVAPNVRTLAPDPTAVSAGTPSVFRPNSPTDAILLGLIRQFHGVYRVNDASNTETSASTAWTIDVGNGCNVFVGEYGSQRTYNDARKHWATDMSLRIWLVGDNVVVTVIGCDSGAHRSAVEGQVDTVMAPYR